MHPAGVSGVVARPGFAPEIVGGQVDDDVVQPAFARRVVLDQIEGEYRLAGAYAYARLFEHFPLGAGLEAFAPVQPAAGKGPLACRGRAGTPDEKHCALMENDGPHAGAGDPGSVC